MVAKVELVLYVEVADQAQAEEACSLLGSLDTQINDSFPGGDVIDTDVQLYTVCSQAELEGRGLVE